MENMVNILYDIKHELFELGIKLENVRDSIYLIRKGKLLEVLDIIKDFLEIIYDRNDDALIIKVWIYPLIRIRGEQIEYSDEQEWYGAIGKICEELSQKIGEIADSVREIINRDLEDEDDC